MSKFKLALAKTTEVVADKKIGPIKIGQVIDLPLGPMYIVHVGNINKGIMPTMGDLKLIGEEFKKQAKRVKHLDTNFSVIFFPPFLHVKECFFTGGTLYLFLLGDLNHGIMPTISDLEALRDLIGPELKRMGLRDPAVACYPPIIETTVIENMPLFVIGNLDKGFNPSRKEGQQIKSMMLKCMKSIGVRKCMVAPAAGSWRSDAKAFV